MYYTMEKEAHIRAAENEIWTTNVLSSRRIWSQYGHAAMDNS